jgi:arginyl-tRNA synthetase
MTSTDTEPRRPAPLLLHSFVGDLMATLCHFGKVTRLEFRGTLDALADLRAFLVVDAAHVPVMISTLSGDSRFAELRYRKRILELRLSEEMIEQLVFAIPLSDLRDHDNPWPSRSLFVQFIDPNATKAFHLGHLYEAVLGHALASLYEALGAAVTRLCFVSDISRSVCEAIAGWRESASNTIPKGRKSDHFVGEVYSNYTRAFYAQHPEEIEIADPVRRETRRTGDAADDLMDAYMRRDAGCLEDWKRLRQWVVDGWRETLQDYAIAVDCFEYGSELEAVTSAFVDRGLDLGVLEREPGGAVLYRSGRKEYEVVVILRADGFPTEHARQLSQIYSSMSRCRDLDCYISLMGVEWRPAFTVYESLVRGYGESPYHDLVEVLCHGMVLVDGSKMKSSEGAAVLADDLLGNVASAAKTEHIATISDGTLDKRTVAVIAIKCYFLSRNVGKDVLFSEADFNDEVINPGWRIGLALATGYRARKSPSHLANISADRLYAMQWFELRRVLLHAASARDSSSVLRFVTRLADTYLCGSDPRSGTESLLLVLQTGLRSIGVLPAKSSP